MEEFEHYYQEKLNTENIEQLPEPPVRNESLEKDSWYEVLKKQVDEETAEKVRELIRNGDKPSLTAVHLEDSSIRAYPYSRLACHVIGFVGSENRGLEGTEAMYDRYRCPFPGEGKWPDWRRRRK